MCETTAIEIEPVDGDDDAFIAQMESTVRGITIHRRPKEIRLVRIDNWFGSRWLRFSGKFLGAIGVRESILTVPPFVPSRVIWERHYAAPAYRQKPNVRPIHIEIRSSEALKRRAFRVAPGAALMWFSGKSEVSGRGAIMSYIPTSDGYWTWYAGWSRNGTWNLCELVEISPHELAALSSSQI